MNSSASGKPVFIALDGIDGVGKSTQIERLQQHLGCRGHDVLVVQDPGTTPIGTKLRQILLDGNCDMHRRTEAMLFMASRCELIEKVIRPAIAAGQSVISDRFLLANVVYQSVGGEVSAEQLWQMGRLANDDLQPDVTILLDMPADAAIKRLNRPADRMESRGVEYMEAVRQAFLTQLACSSPETIVVNADQRVDDVTRQMLTRLDTIMQRPPADGTSSS